MSNWQQSWMVEVLENTDNTKEARLCSTLSTLILHNITRHPCRCLLLLLLLLLSTQQIDELEKLEYLYRPINILFLNLV